MSKLQILITQYSETENLINPLLRSIDLQQGIDLKNDIEVFIGNDGSNIKLTEEFLKTFTFPIKYFFFEHSGLAGCRKKLFDISTADYIMYCDADDMFLSNTSIHSILSATKDGFDNLVSCYVSEHITQDGSIIYNKHEDDSIHVHGKVYRRQFLIDNCIEWHSELHEHQDSPYNCLARFLSKKEKKISDPIYMWKYNSESVTRKNSRYAHVRTWDHFIDAMDCLVSDVCMRGFGHAARYYSMYCIYITFYEMLSEPWFDEESSQYKEKTYKRLLEFFNKYKLLLLYQSKDEKTIDKIKEKAKEMTENRYGKIKESSLSIEEWMQSIINLYN